MVLASEVSRESVVKFPIAFAFEGSNNKDLQDAAEAVKTEYRQSVRCKALRCRSVSRLTDQKDDGIFVLEVGQSVEFDWTWEGATAFRPSNVEDHSSSAFSKNGFESSDSVSSDAWSGEIVEVDEANGRIYVWMNDTEKPPTSGLFFVRPFEFMAFLNNLYCDPAFQKLRSHLPARLNACRGNSHPKLTSPMNSSMNGLAGLWSHSWGVLWGPPGTGKTYTIGQQVAKCLADRTERILVVSTTNKATDEAAVSIGKACQKSHSLDFTFEEIARIGKSAHLESFEKLGLDAILKGSETDLLRHASHLSRVLHRSQTHEERAIIRRELQSLRKQMKDASFNSFVSEKVRVVVATAFKATMMLNDPEIRSSIEEGNAPFTTIFIDESGLLSRAATAALTLLASRRVVLVGDSKQLAPISRMSRVLPTSQATWLASSGLSHLNSLDQAHDAIHLLREQHRMHPEVCDVVSAYQYENKLVNGASVSNRSFALPDLIQEQPRAIWYVLDEDGDDIPSIRAERGPGNRSWVRPKTRSVLKKLFSDEKLKNGNGLFISPFMAQARDVRRYFAEEGMHSWSAATVHSQQGTEADYVIFDTVNAGSYGWQYDEWKRLVNVGLSRAREFVLVLASRAEMREPYIRALNSKLSPRILKWSGRAYKFVEVPAEVEYEIPESIADNPQLIGNQISKRKEMRPVLSFEQQRLCGLAIDGKPRLVRGVAGSGKTVVLAHWLLKAIQRLKDRSEYKIWAVYANNSLHKLITETIEEAWKSQGDGTDFPWQRVELCHIKDLLELLLPRVGLRVSSFEFDYDRAAEEYLRRIGGQEIKPLCDAMFIDEAQDMGPHSLKLLSALVAKADENDPNSRSINIFYDNAQNVYGRSTPKWSELGLDMRGRSTVMKESFRSTKQICEYALNVLYRLQPSELNADHKELVDRGLIERIVRNKREWWTVRFNQVEGPPPILKKFAEIESEFEDLGDQLVHWIKQEGIKPRDICVLYNGKNLAWRLETQVAPKLKRIGVNLAVQTGKSFNADQNTVIASTSHSFKGYDAEVVVVAGADQFFAKEKGVLANNLYVALTRARSILAIYGQGRKKAERDEILTVLEECLDTLIDKPTVDKQISSHDDFEDVVDAVGQDHREWLEKIWKQHWIEQEPILSSNGEILAEPVFWFKTDEKVYACFGNKQPGRSVLNRLEDAGIGIVSPFP